MYFLKKKIIFFIRYRAEPTRKTTNDGRGPDSRVRPVIPRSIVLLSDIYRIFIGYLSDIYRIFIGWFVKTEHRQRNGEHDILEKKIK